jgi:hypothetical protein
MTHNRVEWAGADINAICWQKTENLKSISQISTHSQLSDRWQWHVMDCVCCSIARSFILYVPRRRGSDNIPSWWCEDITLEFLIFSSTMSGILRLALGDIKEITAIKLKTKTVIWFLCCCTVCLLLFVGRINLWRARAQFHRHETRELFRFLLLVGPSAAAFRPDSKRLSLSFSFFHLNT